MTSTHAAVSNAVPSSTTHTGRIGGIEAVDVAHEPFPRAVGLQRAVDARPPRRSPRSPSRARPAPRAARRGARAAHAHRHGEPARRRARITASPSRPPLATPPRATRDRSDGRSAPAPRGCSRGQAACGRDAPHGRQNNPASSACARRCAISGDTTRSTNRTPRRWRAREPPRCRPNRTRPRSSPASCGHRKRGASTELVPAHSSRLALTSPARRSPCTTCDASSLATVSGTSVAGSTLIASR